ncbi:nucleotide exchange factor GrpE [Paenibacillus phoenicis]|uniref:Protein GrpE n=1 Tax=Paenibacillus phoenicis TaxID=554117 RepID=A0ABU5PKA7_9BACL|nr:MULTISPECIES: nucleotide exchange factor GrpE [Paenibacillus]MCT2194884.1 nucleotide exchange factor GrpE [Paenibacillus sp. p3-SID1389]MEA3570325.1 nucleotide exchange factor GrpE [Paenibacillus phoenicis]
MNDNVKEDLQNTPESEERQDEVAAQEPQDTQDAAGGEGAAEAVNEANNADVTAELEKLRAENEEFQQRLLRAQADFDNFRRRTVKEKEELGKYASAKLITELLPVIDNFERALNTTGDISDAASYVKGVEMIFRQLEGVLKAEGLTPMEAEGQPFNPEFHQAIMQVESEEHEEGIVVEVVQKGYMLKDKVLRPAMVKVSG